MNDSSCNRTPQIDRKVLADYVAKYSDKLVCFARCFVGDFAAAEDIAADAFAVTFLKPRHFPSEAQLKSYLYKVARSKALDYLRRNKRIVNADDFEKELSSDPEREIFERDQKRRLYIAMQSLKTEYKDVLFLLFVDGFSVEEVCSIMSLTKKQVYNLSERAKNALRKILSPEDIL